jgi:glycine cleavage system transcriptional repressor
MRENFVFTLTGADRVGIVDTVTRMLLDHGGNVETSRMARLGGEFAILMLVSMPQDQLDSLKRDVEELIARGYKVATSRTGQTYAEAHPGWLPYQIEVQGADHEGIIHQIAHYLSERGINIESMDTETGHAPVSGTPLFSMTALVAVPPNLSGQGWERALEGMGNQLNVDIKVSVAGKR